MSLVEQNTTAPKRVRIPSCFPALDPTSSKVVPTINDEDPHCTECTPLQSVTETGVVGIQWQGPM